STELAQPTTLNNKVAKGKTNGIWQPPLRLASFIVGLLMLTVRLIADRDFYRHASAIHQTPPIRQLPRQIILCPIRHITQPAPAPTLQVARRSISLEDET